LITISQEDVVVVGRIVASAEIEPMSGPSKLNEASITLESSRMMGSGVRVPLRFNTPFKIHGSSRVGFFPGAIVALRGRNGGGGWFSVSEVLSVGEDLKHVSLTLTWNAAASTDEWSFTSAKGRRGELVQYAHRGWAVYSGYRFAIQALAKPCTSYIQGIPRYGLVGWCKTPKIYAGILIPR
jgi:hypothetical protein